MARRTLGYIMASPPDVDRARLAATTEAEIRRHAGEDGHDPDGEIDGYRAVLAPRAVRKRLGLTQTAFAAALRVPVGTVRNWEQARTLPDPAARSLLDAVAVEPDAVLGALRERSGRLARGTNQATVPAASGESLGGIVARASVWPAQQHDAGERTHLDAPLLAARTRLRGDIFEAALLPDQGADRDLIDVGAEGIDNPTHASERIRAARERVRNALDAVGEDLSGLLIDLCGFLKDPTRIEMERRWPPRSAGVVIRIALRRLTKHYDLTNEAAGTIEDTDQRLHAQTGEADHGARRA